jgi:hypothetical protein
MDRSKSPYPDPLLKTGYGKRKSEPARLLIWLPQLLWKRAASA